MFCQFHHLFFVNIRHINTFFFCCKLPKPILNNICVVSVYFWTTLSFSATQKSLNSFRHICLWIFLGTQLVTKKYSLYDGDGFFLSVVISSVGWLFLAQAINHYCFDIYVKCSFVNSQGSKRLIIVNTHQ